MLVIRDPWSVVRHPTFVTKPEERFSAKRMRQWSRGPDKHRRFAPRSAPLVAHAVCPEVMARSRTVQLVSGVTRRRVQNSAPPSFDMFSLQHRQTISPLGDQPHVATHEPTNDPPESPTILLDDLAPEHVF